jgi:hypothetical protein
MGVVAERAHKKYFLLWNKPESLLLTLLKSLPKIASDIFSGWVGNDKVKVAQFHIPPLPTHHHSSFTEIDMASLLGN